MDDKQKTFAYQGRNWNWRSCTDKIIYNSEEIRSSIKIDFIDGAIKQSCI